MGLARGADYNIIREQIIRFTCANNLLRLTNAQALERDLVSNNMNIPGKTVRDMMADYYLQYPKVVA